MDIELKFLKPQERASLRLRMLYEQAGYRKYHMSRFEEYSLYQENRRFLPSEEIITFTDLDGRLLALKPDVTLSIAKKAQPAAGTCEKYYYLENVYRPSPGTHTFREIAQMGLECIGAVDGAVMNEAVSLAMESLSYISEDFALELSHMGFVTGLFDAVGIPEDLKPRFLELIRNKNEHEIKALSVKAALSSQGLQALCRLLTLNGEWRTVSAQAENIALNRQMFDALSELFAICEGLEKEGKASRLKLDFSLVNDMDYYNGLVFQGYISGLPRAVLRGGRYDPLADKFCSGARAVGFALYLDELELPGLQESSSENNELLSIALPKGRLGDKVYELLSEIGYSCPGNYNDTRKLVIENPQAGIRYFLVKPSDVAIYVERGAADVGIVGKDILQETGADVYELLDTNLGKCRMCVAAQQGFEDDISRTLRVATKFVNIAKDYYAAQGRDIDIIKLNGSIELAPLLGLSDVIVDIVETGTTLRENALEVVTEFMPISARLIANRASYQFKNKAICLLLQKLSEVI